MEAKLVIRRFPNYRIEGKGSEGVLHPGHSKS